MIPPKKHPKEKSDVFFEMPSDHVSNLSKQNLPLPVIFKKHNYYINKMEINIEQKFNITVDEKSVKEAVDSIRKRVSERANDINLKKKCISLIDLTTLNPTDGTEHVEVIAEKINRVTEIFPDVPNFAAICIYPSLVSSVKQTLKTQDVKIASVAAGFPSSQTFIDIKLSECQMCLEMGADELDVVISLGDFLEGDYFTVFSELQQIKEVAGDAKLKVILETGLLPSWSDVKLASFLAMEAGADFIKTSTGKVEPAATPEAVYVMSVAIKEYFEATGRRVGIKPAGGMATPDDAILFYMIVETVLGQEWLNNNLLRFGTSRLSDKLLSDITGQDVKYFSASASESKY